MQADVCESQANQSNTVRPCLENEQINNNSSSNNNNNNKTLFDSKPFNFSLLYSLVNMKKQ